MIPEKLMGYRPNLGLRFRAKATSDIQAQFKHCRNGGVDGCGPLRIENWKSVICN
jgi:hypothetical protein